MRSLVACQLPVAGLKIEGDGRRVFFLLDRDGSVTGGPKDIPVQRGLYVINADSTVAVRPVKVAQVSNGQALIDSGLSAGEQVVVDGQYKLQPGIHVILLEGKAAQEAAAQAAQQTPIP